MAKAKSDSIYGTLDMLILKALQHEPRQGLGIADRIQQMSDEVLRVEQGSLYPALYRLEAGAGSARPSVYPKTTAKRGSIN